MSRRRTWVGFLAAAMLTAAFLPGAEARKRSDEPDVVIVQHILVGFKRSIPGQKLDRTKKEAAALAEKLLERARAGEDFDALVKEFTNDQYPGIMKLTNHETPLMSNARTRRDMVPWFGDRAFELGVGEFGLVKYHGGNSPYGWHVMKRLE